MEGHHEKRHRLAVQGLMNTYGLITKVLLKLPLPIRLQPLRGSIYADDVDASLLHAWESLQDLPMDAEVKEWVGLLILDWIMACDYLFQNEEDPKEWHLHLVGMQLARILAGADLVNERLASQEE